MSERFHDIPNPLITERDLLEAQTPEVLREYRQSLLNQTHVLIKKIDQVDEVLSGYGIEPAI